MSVKTLHLKIDAARMESAEAGAVLDRAATILRQGGLVALPTETVYGLGANALDPAAVARIFSAKQRPAWDPVIVHIAPDWSPSERLDAMLDGLVEEVPAAARKLMEAFWPGPLTLLLPRTRAVPDAVTAGRPLVGVRMPAHPVALELIRRAGVPVAAPSANVFGHISPTTAQHVLDDLDGCIEAVVDGGATLHGVESTVLDPNQSPMVIYRPGAVTVEQIRAVAGPVEFFKESGTLESEPQAALPSPGVGLRHYAPRARLIIVDATPDRLSAELEKAAAQWRAERIGVMLPAGVPVPAGIASEMIYHWGRWDSPEAMAHDLYAGLRALDAQGCTVILSPLPPEGGIGAAIRDRLRKAAR